MVERNRTNRAQYTSLQIKNEHNTIQKQIHIRISLKPLIYQDILHLIQLLQLNTTAILDLPSYTYVKCIPLKKKKKKKKKKQAAIFLSLLKTGFNALGSICKYE